MFLSIPSTFQLDSTHTGISSGNNIYVWLLQLGFEAAAVCLKYCCISSALCMQQVMEVDVWSGPSAVPFWLFTTHWHHLCLSQVILLHFMRGLTELTFPI